MTTPQWGATADDGGTPIGDPTCTATNAGHSVDTHQWTLNVVDTLKSMGVHAGGHLWSMGTLTPLGGHLALRRDTRKSQGAFLFSSANLSHAKIPGLVLMKFCKMHG